MDDYDEDWSALWWVRADGYGVVRAAGSPEVRTGVDALVEK